jgi:hypothetical protein
MLPQAPLEADSSPTTFTKSYYVPSSSPASMFEAHTSHHDAVRITRTADLGSTAKGIMIGIFSVLGAAGVCMIFVAIVYYFRYTQRIFLDRLSRPGEYDDEQQFAKEEAEALEDMDDIQRTEYMRAKGMHIHSTRRSVVELAVEHMLTHSSLRASQPSRVGPDGHFLIAILGNTREGRVCLGVRT